MKPVIIGIGGAHSGSGKTECASFLIRNLRNWGAIKYTKTAIYSSVTEDIRILSKQDKDTKRLLDAGAEKVVWVQSPPDQLSEVLPLATEKLAGFRGIIVEGNSAIEFLSPDIIIFVFGKDPKRIKESSKKILGMSDVVFFDGEPTADIRTNRNVKLFARSFVNSSEFFACIERMIGKMETKERLKTAVMEKAINGKLPCPAARRIAEEMAVPYKEVGDAADELKIKIADCELGCF